MNLFARYLMTAAAVLGMACACSKETVDFPIAANVSATGSLRGDTFTDDNGVEYRITSTASDVVLQDMNRALATINVIEKISDKVYSAQLVSLYRPLCKSYAVLSEATGDMLGDDPVLIGTGWISGGYVNLGITFTRRKDSDLAHQIELVLDDSTQDGTLRFRLHHNGFGEGFASEGDRSSCIDVQGFVCFDVSTLVPEEDRSIPVSITAPWYETVAGDIRTGNTIDLVIEGRLSR